MSLAKLFVEVGADVNQFERGMKNVRSEMDRTAKQASFFSNALSTAIGTGISTAVGKAVFALTDLSKSVISTGISFNSLVQNSTLAFETMLQSADKATKFIEDLKDFAKKTPFELPGLIESSQRLLAFGFEVKKVIPMMTTIGDAVAGLGGSPEKLNRVILAFGQIRAKGRLMAGEMLQLTEAGIGGWDMIAKKLGVSIPEAMKKGEQGLIDSETAISAILEGMQKKFGGLMSKQAKSWSGMTSNIKDTFTQLTGRVMKPFFDLGLKGMQRLLDLFDSPVFETFTQRLVKGSSVVATILGKIGKFGFNIFESLFGVRSDQKKTFSFFELIPKKIKNLLSDLQPVKDFIYNIANKGFKTFANVFNVFYRAINKISSQKFDFFGNMDLAQFATGIKSIFNDIKSGGRNLNYWLYTAPKVFQVITRLMLNAKNIFNYFSGEGLQTTLKKLGSILTGLGSILAKLVRPFKDALGGLFQQLSTMKNLGFADIFTMVLKSIGQALSGFLKVIKDEFWPTIKGALIWVWDSLTAFIKTIDWSAVGNAVSSVFNSIVTYVQSIDWAKLWLGIWAGLSAIGSFFVTTVMPPISSFFSWLLSWFSDSTKNTQLLNAITATWTFVTDWASYIWSGISPYLTSFFGWLTSWFTDSNKRQKLWSVITSTWNIVTEWAANLWNWISPHLTGFFNYLLSWFTDSTKRSQLWNGIVTAWNWITEWAKSISGWVSPYLTQFWNWLSSWVTDPTKRQTLWNGLVSSWDSFTSWASNLWTWISPKLGEMYNNLIYWLDTQKPGLGTALDGWKSQFVDFAIKTKDAFNQNLPQLSKATSEASASISKDIGNMLWALKQLFTVTSTEGATTVSDWAKLFTSIYTIVTKVTSGVVKAVSSMVQALSIMKQAIGGMTTGNFDFSGLTGQLNDLIAGMQGSIIEDIAKWIDPLYWIGLRPDQIQGHATGGIVTSPFQLVGENGPEIAQLPKGTRIWDHGQSRGMLDGNGSTQTITIVLKNEGTLPTDRKTIDEIAMQLQRRLNLQGNRLVFA